MDFRKAYQSILMREFDKKKRHNPAYSMRAYSRDLGIQTSKLSEILNDKKGLSKERATDIVDKLKLNPQEAELFVVLVTACHSRSAKERKEATERLKDQSENRWNLLDIEKFQAISNWYHFAILELTNIAGFKLDSHWIAQRLQISADEAVTALQRLLRMKLLVDEQGSWKSRFEHLRTDDEVSSQAIREHHHQMMDLGKERLNETPVELREFQSLMMAINFEKLPEVKKKVKDFILELSRDYSVTEKADRLYGCSVQVFPIDNQKSEQNREQLIQFQRSPSDV